MRLWLISSLAILQTASAAYNLVQDYSGSNFFSGWDYYGYYDNTTSGDVNFLDQANATSQKLAYINTAGNAIIKVDNTSNVIYNDKRNSIKITSQDAFGVGSLFIMDAVHMPYGCSVWPSLWTRGASWPAGGEIDIVEAVNLMSSNQMALHTFTGCTQANGTTQSGTTGVTDCSNSAGCTVTETKPNSYGAGFAQVGGGVFAAQFDVSGIFIWFWSRADIPASITQATGAAGSTMDVSSWGTPSASYPASSCNITEYFEAQYIVLDITLCGIWATDVYNQTCSGHGSTGICYNDNVIGPGSPEYDDAYFEIPYVRAYSVNPPSNSSSSSASASTSGAKSTATGSSTSSPSSSAPGLAAMRPVALGIVALVLAAIFTA